MRAILRHWRPLGYFLIVAVLSLSLPRHRAEAAFVTTESLVDLPGEGQAKRERLRAFLNRAEVRAQLEAYGISPEEAGARVESLTDREIAVIAGKVDRLPAGGQGVPPGAGLAALVILVAVVAAVVGVIMGIKWIFDRLAGSQEQKAD